jgi:hypothetical protein
MPPGLNEQQSHRLQEKFGAESGFAVHDRDLYYNPNNNINLDVVRLNDSK